METKCKWCGETIDKSILFREKSGDVYMYPACSKDCIADMRKIDALFKNLKVYESLGKQENYYGTLVTQEQEEPTNNNPKTFELNI